MQVGSWTFFFFFACRAGPDRLEECRLEECKWRKIGRSEECSIPQFFRLQLRNEECSVDTSQQATEARLSQHPKCDACMRKVPI